MAKKTAIKFQGEENSFLNQEKAATVGDGFEN